MIFSENRCTLFRIMLEDVDIQSARFLSRRVSAQANGSSRGA
jgi:hypothetical protein